MNYVCIDGPNGCGKSSVANALCRRLRVSGVRVALVREPHDVFFVNRLASDPIVPQELLVGAFMTDRARTMRECATKGYDVVVSDRSYISTYVHQSGVDRRVIDRCVDSLPIRVDVIFVLFRDGRRTDSLLSSLDLGDREAEEQLYRAECALHDNVVAIDVDDMLTEDVVDYIMEYIS